MIDYKKIIRETFQNSLPEKMLKVIDTAIIDIRADSKINFLMNNTVRKSIKDNVDSKSMEALADIIKKDELLTEKIIRVSNSPFYPRLTQVKDLKTAIVTIGTKEIVNILSHDGLSKILKQNKEIVAIRSQIFNSIYTATIFEKILKDFNILDKEEYFSDKVKNFWGHNCSDYYYYGLMYKISQVILLYYFKDKIKDKSNNYHNFQNEIEYFGITHDLFSLRLSISYDFHLSFFILSGLHSYSWNLFKYPKNFQNIFVKAEEVLKIAMDEDREINNAYLILSYLLNIITKSGYMVHEMLINRETEFEMNLFFESSTKTNSNIKKEINKISSLIGNEFKMSFLELHSHLYGKNTEDRKIKPIMSRLKEWGIMDHTVLTEDVLSDIMHEIYTNLRT